MCYFFKKYFIEINFSRTLWFCLNRVLLACSVCFVTKIAFAAFAAFAALVFILTSKLSCFDSYIFLYDFVKNQNGSIHPICIYQHNTRIPLFKWIWWITFLSEYTDFPGNLWTKISSIFFFILIGKGKKSRKADEIESKWTHIVFLFQNI